jgi:hypothetical protein
MDTTATCAVTTGDDVHRRRSNPRPASSTAARRASRADASAGGVGWRGDRDRLPREYARLSPAGARSRREGACLPREGARPAAEGELLPLTNARRRREDARLRAEGALVHREGMRHPRPDLRRRAEGARLPPPDARLPPDGAPSTPSATNSTFPDVVFIRCNVQHLQTIVRGPRPKRGQRGLNPLKATGERDMPSGSTRRQPRRAE